MKLLKIQIEKGFFSKAFTFSRFMNLIYSEKNSVGKTTLLRLIFWGLGYEIPSTKIYILFRLKQLLSMLEYLIVQYLKLSIIF